MPEHDEIRLTLPPDADLVDVVVAAVGAAVRQTGLGPEEVARARETAAAGFARQLDHGSGAITVIITSRTSEYTVAFERASLPMAPGEPPGP